MNRFIVGILVVRRHRVILAIGSGWPVAYTSSLIKVQSRSATEHLIPTPQTRLETFAIAWNAGVAFRSAWLGEDKKENLIFILYNFKTGTLEHIPWTWYPSQATELSFSVSRCKDSWTPNRTYFSLCSNSILAHTVERLNSHSRIYWSSCRNLDRSNTGRGRNSFVVSRWNHSWRSVSGWWRMATLPT